MIRKQIFLTPDLERQIALTAATEGKPQAQVVRETLHAGFARRRPARNGGDALLALAGLAGNSDDPLLSRRIDDYLYDYLYGDLDLDADHRR
jgi:hypothetical protein